MLEEKNFFLLNIFYFSIWLTSNKLYCTRPEKTSALMSLLDCGELALTS